MADSKIVIGVGTEGVAKTKTELNDIKTAGEKVVATNEKLAKSNEKVSSSYKGAGGAIRNTSYQVQDFATQVGSGTSATVALGQQLPQLLSGFGLFGVVIGTAVAVIIPLIDKLGILDNALDKSAKSFKKATDSINEMNQFGDDIASFSSKFGRSTADGFVAYTKAYNDASVAQQKVMERTLELRVKLLQLQIAEDKIAIENGNKLQRAARNLAVELASAVPGMTKESATKTIGSSSLFKLSEEDRLNKELALAEKEQALADAKAFQSGDKSILTKSSAYLSYTNSVDQLIKSLEGEATFYGKSNAEKEKAVKLAELEAQSKNAIGSFNKEDLKVKKAMDLIDEKHATLQQHKIDAYIIQADAQQKLIELEGRRLSLSDIAYKKEVENIKLEADIAKETLGWNEDKKASYEAVAKAKLKEKQATDELNEANKKSFSAGVTKALKDYREELADVAKSAEALLSNAFKNIEDAMVSAFMGGKLSFKAMIDAMMADISRMIVRQALLRPLYQAMGLGGGGD
ncbi:phage tail tape measure C-terminal domain-containing protein, partial [Flavobacterium sp.]|uniref:phage tail tape measure C-terminal domain-containing protein n=1 Tax=Flavobacterium sp. TaxID=239 RepID=UPI0037C0379C